MGVLTEYPFWLLAMAVLLLCSGFFSSSEAALFYLTPQQRRRLAAGNSAAQVAARLLADSDRLLTAVLFWNLVVNLAYFTIVSILSLELRRTGQATEAGVFAAVSLLAIIFLGEMLPKSLAVLQPQRLSTLVGIPLAAMVRLVAPLIPALRLANLLSRRLIWPRFQAEPYLQVRDLERAVELSTSDAALVEQEQVVLQSIVSLSEIRVAEMMRPRTRFLAFRPPVSLEDLRGQLPPSGYLLITETGTDEVVAAVPLDSLYDVPTEHLERLATMVAYVPWCTSGAEALDVMQKRHCRVIAVVNELGETIGILTFEDILDTIFGRAPSRSQRLLKQASIRQAGPELWQVTGMTSLRRLVRHFRVARPAAKSSTVAGVVQEVLERFPEPGDECVWGPFCFKVTEVTEREQMLVELRLARVEEGPS